MTTIEQNIQGLTRAVLNEARTQADQVLTDSRARAEAIQQQAQSRADAVRTLILTQARQQAERIRGQILASAQLQARRLQLERREALLDRVFEATKGRLSAVQGWTEYPEIIQQFIREGATQLKADAIQVRADKQTMALLDKAILDQLSHTLGIDVQLGNELEQGIGVIVETVDGHRQFDNTLEARMHRMRDELRAPVYHLLMGESL